MKIFAQRKIKILLLLTVIIVVLDQWSKALILKNFRLLESVDVVSGFFNLTYIQNTGAAFGVFAKSDPTFRVPFFLIIPVIALTAIGFVFAKLPKDDIKLSTALSLVVGGAIGNLLDRLNHGFVVDFLDFHWKGQYHFPAFNVADSAICVGVAILMLDLVVNENSGAEVGAASRQGR
jgi:signal peptidase II